MNQFVANNSNNNSQQRSNANSQNNQNFSQQNSQNRNIAVQQEQQNNVNVNDNNVNQEQQTQLIQNFQYNKIQKDYKESSKSKYSKILLLSFQIIFYFIVVYSYAWGNPDILGQPYDIDESPCGAGSGKEEYKYLYFVNPQSEEFLYRTLCVKNCPQLQDGQKENDDSLSLECHPNVQIASCDIRYQPDHPEFTILYYNTVPFINVCIPTEKQKLQNIMSAIQKPLLVRILSDFHNSKLLFTCIILFTLFLNFSIIYKIDDYPRFVIWLISILGLLGFFISSVLGFYFIQITQNNSQLNDNNNLTQEQVINYIHSNYIQYKILYIISIIQAIFGFLMLIYLIIWRKNVTTSGSKAEIINNLLLTDQPEIKNNLLLTEQKKIKKTNYLEGTLKIFLLLVIGLALFFLFMLYISFYLFSSTQPKLEQHLTPFQQFQLDPITITFSIVIIIQLILIPILLLGISKLIVINIMIETYKIQSDQKEVRNVQECIGKTFHIHFGELLDGLFKILFLFCSKTYLLNGFRSFILVCLKNQEFSQSAEEQYQFDQNLQNINKKVYQGLDYQLIISFSIANLSIIIIYLLLIYSPICQAIHNPSYIILAVYILSFLISYLFSSLYGMGMDSLTTLVIMDRKEGRESMIGENIDDQFRMIILPNFDMEQQLMEEYLNRLE